MILTIHDLYLELRREFRATGISMAELEAKELIIFVTGSGKNHIANWPYCYLDSITIEKVRELANRRKNGEPLAYILGQWDFYGRTFTVNPNVLIPRPDTETLCELAITDAKNYESPKILDLCAGSGCIGLTLAAEVPSARIAAIDISEDALIVCRENARNLGVTARYFTSCGNALSKPDERLGTFELILCNPPYITADEMKELDKSVYNFEPHIALYGGTDGLDFYRNIIKNWLVMLNSNGKIYFECGYTQADELSNIMKNGGLIDVTIHNDLTGTPRIVCGTKL